MGCSERCNRRNVSSHSASPCGAGTLSGPEVESKRGPQEALTSQSPLPLERPSEADSPSALPQLICWRQKVSIDARLEALQLQMHR